VRSAATRLESIAPVFPVADVDATAAWYRDTLGFEVFPFPADPPWAFAVLQRDGVEIFLERVEGFVKPEIPGRRSEAWDAYVRIRDVAGQWERVAHLPGARGPEKQFYGDTEIEIRDPNGYRLVFGEGPEGDGG
jgi:catechol 2,3-dioxygenase-like lactoylglutathione lyase family enzyme